MTRHSDFHAVSHLHGWRHPTCVCALITLTWGNDRCSITHLFYSLIWCSLLFLFYSGSSSILFHFCVSLLHRFLLLFFLLLVASEFFSFLLSLLIIFFPVSRFSFLFYFIFYFILFSLQLLLIFFCYIPRVFFFFPFSFNPLCFVVVVFPLLTSATSLFSPLCTMSLIRIHAIIFFSPFLLSFLFPFSLPSARRSLSSK